VSGARDERLRMRILNAGRASFPGGWAPPGVAYRAVASYDREDWFRVPTSFDASAGVLTIDHTPARDACYYALAPPYTFERHNSLIAEMQARDGVVLEMVGETLDGHDLDVLRVGPLDDPARPRVWILARQHPGETPAEWFAEGLLRRLLDPADATGRAARAAATFFIVPNCNPDGTWRGHLRTNAAGVNLNRCWDGSADSETAPEVIAIARLMDAHGVDFLCDVHADEDTPAVFAAGCEGVPSFTPELDAIQSRFYDTLQKMCPEFQMRIGYGRTSPGKANLAICKNAVAERFNARYADEAARTGGPRRHALAMTLEMPFSDCVYAPDARVGWSAERSFEFGKDYLGAILDVLPLLRPGKK
jgi:murein tripeptide amidase MpaA